jgi:hypothetical protein
VHPIEVALRWESGEKTELSKEDQLWLSPGKIGSGGAARNVGLDK